MYFIIMSMTVFWAFAATFLIIILWTCAERKWNLVERIVGKKLKVVCYYDPYCIYKLTNINGKFLAINNTEYSFLLFGCKDITDAVVYTAKISDPVEIFYGAKIPVLKILKYRYESWIFNLIFAGNFLPKHKHVFDIPNIDAVYKGSFVNPPRPNPKLVPILIPLKE